MGNGGSGKRARVYHAPCQRPFRRRRILIRVDPTSSEVERAGFGRFCPFRDSRYAWRAGRCRQLASGIAGVTDCEEQ